MSSWLRHNPSLIKKVYEVDPLVCEKCGSEMKIVQFYVEHYAAKEIVEELGLPPFKPPQPLRAPPSDFDYEFIQDSPVYDWEL